MQYIYYYYYYNAFTCTYRTDATSKGNKLAIVFVVCAAADVRAAFSL